MKKILSLVAAMFLMSNAFAEERQNKAPVSSSPNAPSAGSLPMSGASDGALGPNDQEKPEARKRASSMGGAPNAGGGMGTGTGAGSSVGKEMGRGTLTAGAQGGAEEEMAPGKRE